MLVAVVLGTAFASDYPDRRTSAVKLCEAISPREYQSGLLLNPDGYRSYYVQSNCFQDAAIEFRDDSLCTRVRRRWSLFWSSWGVSEEQCRKSVAAGRNADREEITKLRNEYLSAPLRLTALRIERNGNGRDFDLVPEFSKGYAHGYTLRFEIVDGERPIMIHAGGYYLDGNGQMRLYVRQSDIRQRFPAFALNHRYAVRATVILDVGTGGMSKYWSNEFLESTFPVAQRTQTFLIESAF